MHGVVSVHPRGFGFVTFDDGASAFVAPPELNAFLADDVVECRVDTGADGRHSARGLRLLARPRTRLFGTAVHHGAALFVRVDRLVANTDWPLAGELALTDGAQVLARIDGAQAVLERTLDDKEAEIEALLVRHDLAGDHAAAVLDAAERATAPALAGRCDLRGMVTVTIDGPSTRDIDDALLALPPDDEGALRVIVAIADVAAAVPAGGALDDDAKARATSVYLAGKTLPMLPRRLSEDLLSLVEGADRPALTAELRIDVEGRVLAVDVHEAVIRSTARLSYDQVARFLDHGDNDAVPEATRETLRLLRAASARLSQARSERGGKDVEREEISVRLDERGEPTDLEVRK
ncbi:MAG TPA: RNB domain-containing ribonuclease, partial [Myxococcota bacterium]